jgi:hypothetical protein
VDLTGNMTGDLHEVPGDAAHRGPLATDALTGVPVVLRQHDVETPAHDPRLHGIGLALFDMMGITDGPLRDWYGQLMFTNDLHTRRPARACWASDHCQCTRIPAKADDRSIRKRPFACRHRFPARYIERSRSVQS